MPNAEEFESFKDLFQYYCKSGPKAPIQSRNLMSGGMFAKLIRDGGLLDRKFTTTHVDILYAKCKR